MSSRLLKNSLRLSFLVCADEEDSRKLLLSSGLGLFASLRICPCFIVSLPVVLPGRLDKEGLTVIEMNQPVSEAFFFHLSHDVHRRKVNRFITQAKSTPMYDH